MGDSLFPVWKRARVGAVAPRGYRSFCVGPRGGSSRVSAQFIFPLKASEVSELPISAIVETGWPTKRASNQKRPSPSEMAPLMGVLPPPQWGVGGPQTPGESNE